MLFVITSQFIPSNTVQFPGFRLNRNKNSTRTAIVHNNSRTSDAQKWVKQSYMVVFENCDDTNGIERGWIQFSVIGCWVTSSSQRYFPDFTRETNCSSGDSTDVSIILIPYPQDLLRGFIMNRG